MASKVTPQNGQSVSDSRFWQSKVRVINEIVFLMVFLSKRCFTWRNRFLLQSNDKLVSSYEMTNAEDWRLELFLR